MFNIMFNKKDCGAVGRGEEAPAFLKEQLIIKVVVPATVKSCTYFLGICKVNIKQSLTPSGATSYGSEPAFPPLLWAMTTGIFYRYVLGFYTMNHSSSDTSSCVHNTGHYNTMLLDKLLLTKTYCYCKGKLTSISQLLYSPLCQSSRVSAQHAGMHNSLKPDFVHNYMGFYPTKDIWISINCLLFLLPAETCCI